MSHDWQKVQFKKLYSIPLRNGINRPSAVRGSGYKMINMGEIFAHDRLHDIDMELVLLNDKEKQQFKIIENDLIFARQSIIADGAGKCSIILNTSEMTCFESHIIRVRLDKTLTIPLFYYYYFQSSLGKGLLFTIRQQGVQAGIRGSDLSIVKVPLPPLPTQQKIAKILSNYDDLIENNLKRIKLLEESARLTYEEWFLRFRIDGKKLDIDPESDLPFGWEYSSLNDMSSFTNGYAFKSKNFVEHGHPVIKIKNIDGKMVNVQKTNRISADDALIINDKFKLYEGDLLIAMTGATVGKLGFVPYSNDTCYLNQRVGKIKSKYLFFIFLALSKSSGQKQILNFASGAAQPNISGDQILAVKNIIPSNAILDKFEILSDGILRQILNYTRQNQLLKEARDILLPRLMTGMIDTDDMDIAV